jgi:hypothetical protein
VKVVSNGAYKLELLPRYSQLHPVFRVVKLELVKPDPFPGHPRNDEPPPILQTDRDKRWEVAEILIIPRASREQVRLCKLEFHNWKDRVELGVARQELEHVCTIAHNLHDLEGSESLVRELG